MGDEDNTVVMDMKREFQKFVSNEDHRKRTRLEMSQDASFLDATQSSMSSMKGTLTMIYGTSDDNESPLLPLCFYLFSVVNCPYTIFVDMCSYCLILWFSLLFPSFKRCLL